MTTINISNSNITNLLPQKTTLDNAIVKTDINEGQALHSRAGSIYDDYGIEKGFSKNVSTQDDVYLSPLGKTLSRSLQKAEASREVVSENPGNILTGEVDFDSVFKETSSEGGEVIFRRFNTEYLEQVETIPEGLLLMELINQNNTGGIVATKLSDVAEIGGKIFHINVAERAQSIVDMRDQANELYGAHISFTEKLSEIEPELKGVDFEYILDGDQLKVTGAHIGERSLTSEEISIIEQFANSNKDVGLSLINAMKDVRETAVDSYNTFTKEGVKQPISEDFFDDNFGGYSSFLKSFTSSNPNATPQLSNFGAAVNVAMGRLGVSN